jgi:hypothetical protein
LKKAENILKKFIISGIYFTCTSCLFAHEVQGNTSRALDNAIKAANASNTDNTVFIKGNINLTDQVRPLSAKKNFEWAGKNIFVSGVSPDLASKQMIDGNDRTRGFVVEGSGAPTANNVIIENILFVNAKAKGGDGRAGGGGGLGAGGALYVGKNRRVTVRSCNFIGCAAQGGVGGTRVITTVGSDNPGGGGGGLRGDGGESKRFLTIARGGGGGGFGGNGSSSNDGANGGGAGGGASGFSEGNAVVNNPGKDFDGEGSSGQGGVGGAPGLVGGFGGGGGAGSFSLTARDGGFGGGGGGSVNSIKGGNGGDGGGGGGSARGMGGNGGFGAGSGNGNSLQAFGSGPASANKGGDGAAFGGAIFVDTGGQLGLLGCGFFGNEVLATGGAKAIGPDIFLNTGAKLSMDISIRSTMRGIGGPGVPTTSVASMTPLLVDPQVIKTGPGLLILEGDNTFEEGFQIEGVRSNLMKAPCWAILKLLNGTIASGDLEIFNGGNLINAGIVSPGNDEDFGVFQVSGDFINTGRVLATIQPGFLADADLIEV